MDHLGAIFKKLVEKKEERGMFLPPAATAKTSSWIHLSFQIQPSWGGCWGDTIAPFFLLRVGAIKNTYKL